MNNQKSKKFLYFIFVFYFFSFTIFAQEEIAPLPFVSDLDWSSDGTQIAIGIGQSFGEAKCALGYDYLDIHILNLSTTAINKITRKTEGCSAINVDFTSDGQFLIINGGSTVEIWHLQDQQLMNGIFMATLFQNATVSPNNSDIAEVTPLGILLRQVNGTNQKFIMQSKELGNSRFRDAEWSPDGIYIASTESDGTVGVWDSNNKTILRLFTGHVVSTERVVWHPNVSTGLIASGDTDGKILIWDVSNGQIVQQLNGHIGAIRDLDWSPDGTQIASVGADNTLRVWDWQTGEMEIVNSPQESVTSAAYNSDGTQLAYAGMFANIEDLQIHIISVPLNLMITPTPIPPTATPSPMPIACTHNVPASSTSSLNPSLTSVG